jgi:hypothetical protein
MDIDSATITTKGASGTVDTVAIYKGNRVGFLGLINRYDDLKKVTYIDTGTGSSAITINTTNVDGANQSINLPAGAAAGDLIEIWGVATVPVSPRKTMQDSAITD